jgi:hypothetical protein
MSSTKVVEKTYNCILNNLFRKFYVYEIKWKTKKCTVAFPLQQLLRERATMLRYTHTVHTALTANGQAVCFLVVRCVLRDIVYMSCGLQIVNFF